MRIFLLFFLFFTLSNGSFAQVPPPVAMPDKENEPLIDTLVQLSQYELLYDQIKEEFVTQYARDNNWNDEKLAEISSKLEFYGFGRKSRMYNAYAHYSRQELLDRIVFYRGLSLEQVVSEFSNLEDIIVRNMINEIESTCKKASKEN